MAFDDTVIGAAANSKIIEIMLRDSTTGMGKTGLVHDSAGASAYYIREVAAAEPVQIVLDHGTAFSAYNTGDFAEVNATTMPGLYQLHIPNAALETGANAVTIIVQFTGVITSKTRILIDARPADMHKILGHLLTQTGTQLADGFQVFFDVASPTTHKALTGVTLAATQTGVTIPTVTTVTNQLTAAQVATGVWKDTTAGDFTEASSIGKSLYTGGNTPGTASGLPILALVDSILTIPAAMKVINATSIAGTSTQIAAAFIAQYNVATPVFTAASANQGGDAYARMATYRLGELASAALASGKPTADSALDLIMNKDAGQTFARLTQSLEASGQTLTAGVSSVLNATAQTNTTDTVGSRAGTYASTYLSNGTYWVSGPASSADGNGNGLDVGLTFTAGASQFINSVTVRGYFAAGAARAVDGYAYNYITTVWDKISDNSNRMTNASTNQSYQWLLTSQHRKAADGEVKIAFRSTSTTTADRLNIDQAIINIQVAGPSAADIANAVYLKMAGTVYGDGVWLDTVSGVDGYTIGTHGISTAPVLTLACAYSLCASLGFKRLYFRAGSNGAAVQLTQSAAGWRFIGPAVIDINGQSIADSIFEDCYTISNTGSAVGDDTNFRRCGIGNGPFRHGYFWDCSFKNATAFTMYAGDEYHFFDCKDSTPDAGDPATFTFAAGCIANFRGYKGGVQIKSMATGCVLKLDDVARLIIDGSCSGGSVTVRGFAPVITGKAVFVAAGGSITETQRFGTDQAMADTSGTTEILTRVPDQTAGAAGGLAIVGSKMDLLDTILEDA